MADDLTRYLNSLPDKVRQQVSDAVRTEAERLSAAQRAALKAQEQAPDETGDLEASCTTTPGRDEFEVIVQAGGDATTKEVREGSGEPYDYAEAFEYGTSRQPARPFFFNTYDAMRAEIETNIGNAISEALK
ncbi:phage protein, HK97 gp10 family [Rhodopseudomonas palustris TIE-1]|uniref:HK97-gp10 family putative phage morphogenesis protein n=1 Tax=Rhodopseudomonas palustris TaxID=1076 RepID=UPI000164B349|nr:HK97-gp10 family putative phage morphogenesis protein [Rhodopseudomonas palustris]ACF02486.1 phage protein, HK97 gp10 family [Rhodopseudomonas palustris TIE-1]